MTAKQPNPALVGFARGAAVLLAGYEQRTLTSRGENVMIELDIPCDVQSRQADGHLWAFLNEAVHPDVIVAGAFVVTGDEEDPVVARVLEMIDRPGGRKVVMELLGEAS